METGALPTYYYLVFAACYSFCNLAKKRMTCVLKLIR